MSGLRLYKIFYPSIIILFFFISISFSQNINIYPEQPSNFHFKLNDIWNVTIINHSSALDIYLVGTIEDSNSKLLFKAETSDFRLLPGMKKMNVSSIGPIEVENFINGTSKNLNRKSTLPDDKYNICISVISKESNEILCSSCYEYEIVNLSKIGLISPLNGETIRNELPTFSWHSHTGKSGKLSYEIIIVEIYKDQTHQEAMKSNPVIVRGKNITSSVFKYPVFETELQNEKKYAWKVKVFSEDNLVSESGVREFEYIKTLKTEEVTKKDLQGENEKILSVKLNNVPKDEYKINSKDQRINILDNQIISSNRKTKIFKDSNIKQNYFSNNRIKFLAGIQRISKSPFQFLNSNSVINYQYSNQEIIGSELPRSFFSLRFDPTFVFLDVPFSFNLYYDTKQSDTRQNINSLTLRLEPRLLNNTIVRKQQENKSVRGYLKFLSDFDVLNIGGVYPSYSKYTLNGSKLTGLEFEYNPGILYLAFSGLYNLKAIDEISFSRKMLAGKIGIGAERGNHFHLTVLKAWDDENSLNSDQITSGIAPQENFLLGTDGKLKLLDDKLIIEGEIVGSIHTRDMTSAEFDDGEVPGFLQFIISPKISTSVDYMFLIKSTYDIIKSNTKLSGTYKSIGPGYTSLGALGIRNDIRGFKFKIDQRLLDRKIQFSAFMEREENNVGSLNPTTETNDSYGFNIRFNFKDFPYISLDYRPNTVSNNEEIDSLLFNSRSSVFTLMAGVNDFNDDFYSSTNLLISSINSKSTYETGDYKILNFILSNNLSFVKMPLSFAGSVGYTFNDAIINSHIFSFDLSGSYTFFNKMNNTLGFSYIGERDMNYKLGIYFSTSVPLWELGEFYLRAEQNFYRENIFEYGDNNEFILTATISKNWKL